MIITTLILRSRLRASALLALPARLEEMELPEHLECQGSRERGEREVKGIAFVLKPYMFQ